ncbi:MAG: vitamin K epoxide reductase family protein [Patescibacteria group bacterium]
MFLQKYRFMLIALLAGIGAALSALLIYLHYQPQEGWCTVGNGFSCDIVNRGVYGEIAGVPVSFIGIIGYVSLCAMALWINAYQEKRVGFLPLIRIMVAGAFLFSLYLTYLEAFVLYTFCLFCIGSFILVLLLNGVAFYPVRQNAAVEREP